MRQSVPSSCMVSVRSVSLNPPGFSSHIDESEAADVRPKAISAQIAAATRTLTGSLEETACGAIHQGSCPFNA